MKNTLKFGFLFILLAMICKPAPVRAQMITEHDLNKIVTAGVEGAGIVVTYVLKGDFRLKNFAAGDVDASLIAKLVVRFFKSKVTATVSTARLVTSQIFGGVIEASPDNRIMISENELLSGQYLIDARGAVVGIRTEISVLQGSVKTTNLATPVVARVSKLPLSAVFLGNTSNKLATLNGSITNLTLTVTPPGTSFDLEKNHNNRFEGKMCDGSACDILMNQYVIDAYKRFPGRSPLAQR